MDHRHNEDQYLSQRHDHEFLGSVKLAELEDDPHNHRFSGVSGPASRHGNSHVHEVLARTDFYEDHSHKIKDITGPAIKVGDDRHVHSFSGQTTLVDGHKHDFIGATLIENPIGEDE